MPSERCGNNPTSDVVYSILPGVHQGNVNYAFQPDHPQAPPPKYEDVISGEYLKWKDTTHDQTPYYPTNITSQRINLQTQTEQSSTPSESDSHSERIACDPAWMALFATFVFGIFIWRIFA